MLGIILRMKAECCTRRSRGYALAVDNHIDGSLFSELCDSPGPSTPSVVERTFDVVSDEENPFDHDLGLG